MNMDEIKLTLDEFNHICDNPPGSCNCEVCVEYWKKVKLWLKEIGLSNEDNR